MSNELQQLASQFEEEYKKLEEKAKNLVHDAFKKVFDNHPEITAIIWTQYTPYFNDGDTCEFRVNDFSVTNLPAEEFESISSWGEYDGELDCDGPEAPYFCRSMWEKDTRAKFPDVYELEKFAGTTVGEGVFKGAFGDHASVRVTHDGVDVEEFNHD